MQVENGTYSKMCQKLVGVSHIKIHITDINWFKKWQCDKSVYEKFKNYRIFFSKWWHDNNYFILV